MGLENVDQKWAKPLPAEILAQDFFKRHYDDLMTIARRSRRRGGMSETFQTSDILHESYFRMTGRSFWESKDHFFATITLAMRHVIVDHARRKLTAKRGADAIHVSLEEDHDALETFQEGPEQIVAISDLLEKLRLENPRWVKIVNARYFSGMTENETATALDISARTVRRDWNAARKWLEGAIGN